MLHHVGELKSYEQSLARPGTSITIVGTRHITSKKSWQQEFEKAVKHNFFIAIADDELECDIAGKRVRIDEFAESNEVYNERQKKIPSYLQAVHMYRSANKQTLRFEGLSFDVWIEASADDDRMYENQCMYVNKKGMLITNETSLRRNPFHVQRQSHGSFLVLVKSSNDDTEKQMRVMEPPSHAEIDVSKSPKYRQALRDVRTHLESRIKDMLFADSEQDDVTELSDLADILPIKRDAGDQTNLDAFVTRTKKNQDDTKAVVTAGKRTVKDKDGGKSDTTHKSGEGLTTPLTEGGEVKLAEIRMTTGSPDKLHIYGTLLGGSGDQIVHIIIKRAVESKEYDESSRLSISAASAVFVGGDGDGDGTTTKVDILEGRTLAVTTAPRTSGKRLRLDVTLQEPEPVRCAYEIGVV